MTELLKESLMLLFSGGSGVLSVRDDFYQVNEEAKKRRSIIAHINL